LTGTLPFNHLLILKENEATSKAVNDFFTDLATMCKKHRDEKSGKKFLFFAFYSGHGCNHKSYQFVSLYDGIYPLELEIRRFKNAFPDNSYNVGFFDSCRSATGAKPEDMVTPIYPKLLKVG